MQSDSGPVTQASPQNTALHREPPRPLPARSFHRDGPSATRAAVPAPNGQATSDLLSADAVFSVIEAEASSRSLSAVEGAPHEIKPHKPIEISELVLPAPTAASGTDLGHMIPQRMFEPRFETSARQPAIDQLEIDTGMRPETWHGKQRLEPPVAAGPSSKPTRSFWAISKRGIKLLVWMAIGWLALVLALIVAYRFVNPPASTLMLQHWLTGQPVAHKWVPFNEISPNVVRAVLLSEDGRFCQHSGVDLEAIEEAIENTDGRSRGGSTISMQVVKNLFLWPSKSYVRKAIELPLTYLTELVWPKRRIMEIYLNIAQWAPNVFGIGAAAEYHFHKSARALSAGDAARLAVTLPNPLERNAGRPGPGLQRLANAIQVRMRLAPSSQLSCVLPRRLY